MCASLWRRLIELTGRLLRDKGGLLCTGAVDRPPASGGDFLASAKRERRLIGPLLCGSVYLSLSSFSPGFLFLFSSAKKSNQRAPNKLLSARASKSASLKALFKTGSRAPKVHSGHPQVSSRPLANKLSCQRFAGLVEKEREGEEGEGGGEEEEKKRRRRLLEVPASARLISSPVGVVFNLCPFSPDRAPWRPLVQPRTSR